MEDIHFVEYANQLFSQGTLFVIFAIGAAVGLLSAVLGLGGGVVMVPLLPLLVGLEQRETMVISLATVTLIATLNTVVFNNKGLIRWRLALVMGGVSAITAYISALLSFLIPDFALEIILAVLLAVFALKTALDKQLKKFTAEHQYKKETATKGYVFWGSIAGCVSGFTGLGSGILVAPILLGFPWIKNKRMAPTTNAVMMITTPAALIALLSGEAIGVEEVPWWIIVSILFISASIFATIGHRWQHSLKDTQRRYVLMILLSSLSIVEFINAVKAMGWI